MASGYVYCACCGADCVTGDTSKPALCLPCKRLDCDADGGEPRCLCSEGHFPLDCSCDCERA